MSKPNWHRMAALECAAIAWQGRPVDEVEDRTGNILGTAERMMAWLDGYAREAAPQRDQQYPPGGHIEPRPLREDEQLAMFDEDSPLVFPRIDPAVWRTDHTTDEVPQAPPKLFDGLPGLADKVRGMNEAAARIRADIVNNMNGSGPSSLSVPGSPPAEAPPRNVTVEGDGSTTPPIYRFYREIGGVAEVYKDSGADGETLEEVRVLAQPARPVFWREDTRNIVNRWAQWIEPDGEPWRWASYRRYDQINADNLTRVRTDELPAHVPVESRYDTEE